MYPVLVEQFLMFPFQPQLLSSPSVAESFCPALGWQWDVTLLSLLQLMMLLVGNKEQA